MLLTPQQLQAIRQLIADYHSAYAVYAYGVDAVAPQILAQLKAKGLVADTIDTLDDAYVYGAILASLKDAESRKLTYPQFVAHIKRQPVPLSDAQKAAVKIAAQQAGQYIVGLGNKVSTQTGALLIEADRHLERTLRTTIRQEVTRNIAAQGSIENLKSQLGHATQDWTRDLRRIANFETQDAMQRGLADTIAKRHGPDALVAKMPNRDACDSCLDLLLGPDKAPRIFSLAALMAQGTNVGRKAADRRPVVGPLHPNCCVPGTLIMTQAGPKRVEDILPGTLVRTHLGRWRAVTHTWRSAHAGEVVQLHTPGSCVTVTPNHPVYDGAQFVPAGAVAAGDMLGHDIAHPKDIKPLGEPCPGVSTATLLYGDNPDGPFLALVLPDSVWLHEGFVYARDAIADGPVVPALRGKLRFERNTVVSIASGCSLRLEDDTFIDDSLGRLCFRRVEQEAAGILRLSAVAPLPVVLAKQGVEAAAADIEPAGNGVEAQPVAVVPSEDLLGVEGVLDTRVEFGPAAVGQATPDEVAVAAEQLGDGADGHAAFVVEPRDCFRANLQTVRAARREPVGLQNTRQKARRAASLRGYSVQGRLVLEVATHQNVYVELACKRPAVDVAHDDFVPFMQKVIKTQRLPYTGEVYNLSVTEDESYVANSIVCHNCRCTLVRVPPGGGFNAAGQLVPGGTLGVHSDPAAASDEAAEKSMLNKAMHTRAHTFEAFGLTLHKARHVPCVTEGGAMAHGFIKSHLGLLAASVGSDASCTTAYVLHGQTTPDVVALGFTSALDALAAYHDRFSKSRCTAIDQVHLPQLQAFLAGHARDAHATRLVVSAPTEPLHKATQSAQVSVDDVEDVATADANVQTGAGGLGQNFVYRLKKPDNHGKSPLNRQDIAGLAQAAHAQSQPPQPRPTKVDRDSVERCTTGPARNPVRLDVTPDALVPKRSAANIVDDRRVIDRRLAQSKAQAADVASDVQVWTAMREQDKPVKRPKRRPVVAD
jgi:hypothetical protein